MSKIHVLYGNDSFLMDMEYQKIVKEISVEEHDIMIYDMEETNIKEAVIDCETIPFLADNKVVVIKSPYFLTSLKTKSKIDHDIDALIKYIEKPNPSTILIFKAPYEKLDERKNITKVLRSHAVFKQTNRLSEVELVAWIGRNLAARGFKIKKNAVDELIIRTEGDLNVVVSELKKLTSYCFEEKEISLENVKNIVTKNLEKDVFELSNALISKDKAKTMAIYQDLINQKEDPIALLGVISSKYREILKVKTMIDEGYTKEDIAKAFNFTPGRTYHLMKGANAFSTYDVARGVKELAELDYKVKTGQMDKNLALEYFISL